MASILAQHEGLGLLAVNTVVVMWMINIGKVSVGLLNQQNNNKIK